MSDAAFPAPEFKLRVVLVEDEFLVAMMLEDMLGDLGHQVVARAASLSEAKKVASEETFDLAILDLHLAGEQVYPAADIIRARNLPIIFSSGYGTGDLAAGYRNTPALAKPFTRAELASLLGKVFATAK
jgi:CheY-like chemotaxis protein